MQASADRLDRRALRKFGDVIDKRITKLTRRHSVLIDALPLSPGARQLSWPAEPLTRLGETPDQYRRRVATSFLRRGAVIKRDISAYFYYQQQVHNDAIFEFAALHTAYVLAELWVQTQLLRWKDAGKPKDISNINQFFGFYRGKRPQQSQMEKQVIANLIRVRVEQLCSKTGCTIQAALQALANTPFHVTIDEDRGSESFIASKSALEAMYYRKGIYLMYDLRSWQWFYWMYEVAEAVTHSHGQLSPLSKASARYHRLHKLPLIP